MSVVVTMLGFNQYDSERKLFDRYRYMPLRVIFIFFSLFIKVMQMHLYRLTIISVICCGSGGTLGGNETIFHHNYGKFLTLIPCIFFHYTRNYLLQQHMKLQLIH
jgi:hypothetical protein